MTTERPNIKTDPFQQCYWLNDGDRCGLIWGHSGSHDIDIVYERPRCYGVTGTVWSGPQYCGFRAKDFDGNKRPCCGNHLNKQVGIEWFGDRYRYPSGTGGDWTFKHGDKRVSL